MITQLPTLDALKTQARGLKSSLGRTGHVITHAQSLELLAQQMGFRDWNTLFAASGTAASVPFAVGQRVTGRYLGKGFAGQISALQSMAANSRFRLTIRFDEAVNVSKFASMDILRRQINAVVDARGLTAAHTSDGQPHLALGL